MIKVISGTVGVKINGRSIAKTENDKPFSLSPEEEKRLVTLGVAKYVSGTVFKEKSTPALNKPDEDDISDENNDPDEDDGEDEDYSEDEDGGEDEDDGEDISLEYSPDMSIPELKKLALRYSIDVSECKKKPDYIAVFKDYIAENAPPSFDPAAQVHED